MARVRQSSNEILIMLIMISIFERELLTSRILLGLKIKNKTGFS